MRGLTTQNFGFDVRSDLLPGFDLGVDYSLFEGSTLSDSAKFKPFRERITSSFQFSNNANPFVIFSRLFGRAVPPTAPGTADLNPPPDERYARQIASQPVAGTASRSAAFLPPVTRGWQASFTFTAARQRPVVGSNVVQFDPTTQCAALNTPLLRIQYEQCIANALANPAPRCPITSGVVGLDHLHRAAHDVARQQPELQPDRALGGVVADAVRLRAARVREPDRLAAA